MANDWMGKWRRLQLIINEAIRSELVQSIAVLPEDKDKAERHKAKFEALEAVLLTMLEMEEECEPIEKD